MRHHQAIYLSTGIAGLAVSTALLTTPASAKANPNSHYKQSAWSNMPALTSGSDNKSTKPENRFQTESPKPKHTQADPVMFRAFDVASTSPARDQWINTHGIFNSIEKEKINRNTRGIFLGTYSSKPGNNSAIESKEQQRRNSENPLKSDPKIASIKSSTSNKKSSQKSTDQPTKDRSKLHGQGNIGGW